VLLFVDNIFRFTQACAEVSALLGRIPSAVGYQPTLATDLGALQERITSTKKGASCRCLTHSCSCWLILLLSSLAGSITSVQAIYVPADDLTDPAPATTFAHLDATTVLSRAVSSLLRISGPVRGRVSHRFSVHCADFRARYLPGRGPSGLDLAHAHARDRRCRALQHRESCLLFVSARLPSVAPCSCSPLWPSPPVSVSAGIA
jgi:hypothetical protein